MVSLANHHSGSSLALFGLKSQILSASARAGAELGCMWLRGVGSPGFMTAGLRSCVLPFNECFGIVLLSARKQSHKPQQSVGIWPLGAVFCCSLEQAQHNGREIPFLPFHSLSGWEQQCKVGKNQLILPAAGPCLPCLVCQLVPGSLSHVLKAAARSW